MRSIKLIFYPALLAVLLCFGVPQLACAQNLTLTVTNQTQPDCWNSSNGTATVEAAGGVEPYRFSADGGRTYQLSQNNTFLLEGLSRGQAVLVVRDDAGERAFVTVEVEAPEQLRVPYEVSDFTSCNAEDASVLLQPTGGTTPYTYEGPGGNAALQNNLDIGSNDFAVRDANGCREEFTVFIAAPLRLDAGEHTATAPQTCVSNDGEIEVDPPSLGDAPYEYSIDELNFQTDSVFSDLGAAEYTVTVRDANGCLGQFDVMLEPADEPAIDDFTVVRQPACAEVADGVLVLAASGGTEPYEYRLAGEAWQQSDTLRGVEAGPNTLQVRDANGCESSRIVEIAGAGRAQITVVVDEYALCPEVEARNLITITVEDGEPPYQYQTEATGGFVPNNTVSAPFGVQEISVQENNGCITTITYDLEPDGQAFRFEDIVAEPAACGAADGAITIEVAGFIEEMEIVRYRLDGGPEQEENQFTDLAAGEYVVTAITDGCEITQRVEIRNTIDISTNTVRQPLCDGYDDGIVEVTPTGGGAGNFQFSVNGGAWQDGPEVEEFGVNSTLSVRTIEADGAVTCEQSFDIVLEPQEFEIEVTTRQPSCDGYRGNIEFVTTPNVNERLRYNVAGPGATQSAPGLFENLTVGDYTWNVTSINGDCQFETELNNFSVERLIEMQIDTIQPSNCNADDGALIVRAYGNPPFEYSLNGGDFQTENIFENLSADIHGITVRDADGCEDVQFVTLFRPQDFFLDAFVLYASGPEEDDGLINISANGNYSPPLEFYFNGETLPPGAEPVVTRDQNITPGAYFARATDAEGCIAEVYANVGAELLSDTASAIPSFLVTGSVFVDANNNGDFDPNESGLANIPITATSNSGIVNYTATNPLGYYEILLPAGADRKTITVGQKAYHSVQTPASGQYDITQGQEGDVINGRNFAFQEQPPLSGNGRDMKVSVTPAGGFRAGSSILVHLNVLNQGLDITQGQASYVSPADAPFQSAEPAFDAQNGNAYDWNYAESAPGSFQNIRINANLDGGLQPGDLVEFQAEITPDQADVLLANNTAFERLKIDNFAGVTTTHVQWARTDTSAPYWEDTLKAFEDEPLTYTLYFQNTTGQSLNFARVVSNLDPNHDLSTFRLLGSSHPVRFTMEAQRSDDSPNRARPVLHFMFEDIDLPSGSADAAENIGFVKFQIFMDPDETDCDYKATNTAQAYLDYGARSEMNPLNLVINPNPEIVNFTITPEVGVREGDTLTFAYDTTLYADEFEWTFGDEFRMGELDGPGPYSSYYTGGGTKEFLLALENATSGCTTEISRTLDIEDDCTVIGNDRVGPRAARDRIVMNISPEEEAYETQVVTYSAENEGRFPEEQYSWNFGPGAEPQTANGLGPHEVVYAGLQPLDRAERVEPRLTVQSPACDYDVDGDIDILPCPESDFPLDTIVSCESDVIELVAPVVDSVSHVWFNQGQNIERFLPALRYDQPGLYAVEMVHQKTRCKLTAEFFNETTNCDINVPSVFTPNGDGFNDEWEVLANNIEDFRVVVHNRYGQPVFETTNVTEGWRGEDLNGEDVPEGVYFFMLDITSFDGSKIKRTGNITLLR